MQEIPRGVRQLAHLLSRANCEDSVPNLGMEETGGVHLSLLQTVDRPVSGTTDTRVSWRKVEEEPGDEGGGSREGTGMSETLVHSVKREPGFID